MIRTKGEAGTGNVVEAVRHIRTLNKHIKELCNLDEDEVISSESSLSSTKTQALFLVSTQQRGIPSPRSFQSVIQ